MLSVAAGMFAVAAVSFLGCEARGATIVIAAVVCAAVVAGASIAAHGLLPGLVVAFVLAMAAASVLVLVLPPRPRWANPLALASAGVGALCAAAAVLGGAS